MFGEILGTFRSVSGFGRPWRHGHLVDFAEMCRMIGLERDFIDSEAFFFVVSGGGPPVCPLGVELCPHPPRPG